MSDLRPSIPREEMLERVIARGFRVRRNRRSYRLALAGAAVVLSLVVGVVAVRSQRDAPVIGAVTRTPSPADVAHVRCLEDGSIELSTKTVSAQPDGVHLVARIDGNRKTWIDGFDVYVRGPTERAVSAIAPGRHDVGCRQDDDSRERNPQTAEIRVIDPTSHWVSPTSVQCSAGEEAGAVSGADAGAGSKGDPVEILRDAFREEGLIRTTDHVVISGYTNGSDRRFHVVRDGRTIVAGDLWQQDGLWAFNNIESCSRTRG
jgi:hypothetical protein